MRKNLLGNHEFMDNSWHQSNININPTDNRSEGGFACPIGLLSCFVPVKGNLRRQILATESTRKPTYRHRKTFNHRNLSVKIQRAEHKKSVPCLPRFRYLFSKCNYEWSTMLETSRRNAAGNRCRYPYPCRCQRMNRWFPLLELHCHSNLAADHVGECVGPSWSHRLSKTLWSRMC